MINILGNGLDLISAISVISTRGSSERRSKHQCSTNTCNHWVSLICGIRLVLIRWYLAKEEESAGQGNKCQNWEVTISINI